MREGYQMIEKKINILGELRKQEKQLKNKRE